MLMKQARDRQEKLTRHKETEVHDVIIMSHVDMLSRFVVDERVQLCTCHSRLCGEVRVSLENITRGGGGGGEMQHIQCIQKV